MVEGERGNLGVIGGVHLLRGHGWEVRCCFGASGVEARRGTR